MSLQHLFTTARVVRATYQIISTTILLYYIAKRTRHERQVPRTGRVHYYDRN